MLLSGKFAPFTEFNAHTYDRDQYGVLTKADVLVAEFIIGIITDQLGHRLGTFESLYEIGNGGVMRTAGVTEPLLAHNAKITLTDIGGSQLLAAHWATRKGYWGQLGIWAAHQSAMARVDRRWDNAISGICRRLPDIAYHNILTREVPPVAIRIEGHVLCSHTDNEDEYHIATANFFRTMRPGDIAIRIIDVDSSGYTVDGKRFPGYPTNVTEAVIEAESLGLKILGADEFFFDGPSEDTSSETGSSMSALGGIVLLRP